MTQVNSQQLECSFDARRMEVLALGLAGLMACWYLLAMSMAFAGLILSAVGLGSAAILALAGLRFRRVVRVTVNRADGAAVACLVLVGLNALAMTRFEGHASATFWMPLLILAAGVAVRQFHWFAIAAVILALIWYAEVVLGHVEPALSLQTGVALVFTAIFGGLLSSRNGETFFKVLERWQGEMTRNEHLQQELAEVRELLSVRCREGEKLSKQLEDARRLTNTDELTGLANRRQLRALLEENWSAIQHAYHSCSVIYLDLFRFCEFNQSFGYAAGDQVLHRVADILRRLARNELQLAARVGSDEFMMVLPGIGRHGVAEMLQEINTKIERLCLPEFGVEAGRIRAKAGVASIIVRETQSPFDLIQEADLALDRAKAGQGSVVAFPWSKVEAGDSLMEAG